MSILKDQRFILGFAFHADTDDLHFDLCVSRQDKNGGRIGKSGLGLVGPWCVGVDRQIRSGAKIAPQKRSQLSKSVANFRRREGQDAVPLDVQFARVLDAVADNLIGPALALFKAAYAVSVPMLERLHAEAELAALETARKRIVEGLPAKRSHSRPVPPEVEL